MGKMWGILFMGGCLLSCQPGAWNPQDYERTSAQAFQALAALDRELPEFGGDLSLLKAGVFYETNRRRLEAGLGPLGYSRVLEGAAQAHAQEMVQLGYLAHVSPVPEHRHLEDRLNLVGILFAWKGENIAKTPAYDLKPGAAIFPPSPGRTGFRYEIEGPPVPRLTYRQAAAVLVDQWMASPSHKENLLRKEFTRLGVGMVLAPDPGFHGMDYLWAVQNFASGQDVEQNKNFREKDTKP